MNLDRGVREQDFREVASGIRSRVHEHGHRVRGAGPNSHDWVVGESAEYRGQIPNGGVLLPQQGADRERGLPSRGVHTRGQEIAAVVALAGTCIGSRRFEGRVRIVDINFQQPDGGRMSCRLRSSRLDR
ncbi:hypothetical protein OG349_19240 [Streptomyces sp. NBC_01317]|uniref:hypothetical protein n=1 Tax=Streptomyces sp. NBC_01317 TaxID=2903822 RepID=UPI002E0D3893|nr:hypothetical protein OG349_19240 [Streptomyces sp. NBC_01317]